MYTQIFSPLKSLLNLKLKLKLLIENNNVIYKVCTDIANDFLRPMKTSLVSSINHSEQRNRCHTWKLKIKCGNIGSWQANIQLKDKNYFMHNLWSFVQFMYDNSKHNQLTAVQLWFF